MSSGWLPKHRQLFFQIFQEGPNDIIKFFRFTFTFDRTAITFGFVPAFRMKMTFSHDPQMSSGRFPRQTGVSQSYKDCAPLAEVLQKALHHAATLDLKST